MADFDFDLFVIGGGSGGVRAARVAAEAGAKVGLAEEYRYGGTCVIRGCVPKKLLVHAGGFADGFAVQQVLAAVGLRQQVEALQQGLDGSVVRRFLPAVATYAVCYLSICLLLLRLVLPTRAQWYVALRLYAGALGVYVALVALGKLAGDAQWAYRLSRQLLDFIVSPLPVAGLYVLLRSGFGHKPARRSPPPSNS